MDQILETDLKQLGLESARQIAGEEAVEAVDVETSIDSLDQPIYWFSILLNPDRALHRLGFITIRLQQKLHDELTERGDGHYPMVRMLDHDGWARRKLA